MTLQLRVSTFRRVFRRNPNSGTATRAPYTATAWRSWSILSESAANSHSVGRRPSTVGLNHPLGKTSLADLRRGHSLTVVVQKRALIRRTLLRWYERAGLPWDALSSQIAHSIRCKKETGYEKEYHCEEEPEGTLEE